VNLAAVTADLVPTDPSDPAFNPFGAGSGSAASVEKDIALPPQHWRYDSAFSYINASATGKLFQLPAGAIAATVGAEYRRQRFSGEVDSAVSLSSDPGILERNMSAMFAEVAIPVLRGDSTPKRVGALDFSAGARGEVFDGAGPVWAPGMGIRYAATSSLTLMGNWARWYRPPSLPDLSEVNNFAVIAPVPDPSAAGGVSSVLVATGGNARLRPEQAESRNFGIQFAPADWPDFWASIKYFDVRVRERTYTITDLPATVLSDPQYAWLIKSDNEAGLRQEICTHGTFFGVAQDCLNAPISAIVDMRLQNVASLRSAGIDGESKFKIESSGGWSVNFNLISTYFLKYEQAYTSSATPVELVSTAHNPVRFRFRGSVGWTDNARWISTAINYQGRYRDTDALPQRAMNAWTTLDLVLGVVLGDPGRGPDPQTRLSLSASNLFNSYPPVLFSNFGVAYDADNGSLVGRRVNLTLQRRW